MNRAGRLVAALAAASLGSFSVAAQASCWDSDTLAAARLHEFNVRLTVAELRCAAGSTDFVPRIETYFAGQQERMAADGQYLREKLGTVEGAQADAYEKYLTALGNRYGSDGNAPGFCAVLEDMLVELNGEDATADDLQTYALLLVREPMIEGRCPAVLASLESGK